MRKTGTCFFIALLVTLPIVTMAQAGRDSVLQKSKGPKNQALKPTGKDSVGVLNAKVVAGQAYSKHLSFFSSKSKSVQHVFQQSLRQLKGNSSGLELSVSDGIGYQQSPTTLSLNPGQGFINVVGIQGTIHPFGIPLNFNFNNSRLSAGGFETLQNSLYKFDYSPAQFKTLLRSDLNDYDDMRRNYLKGLDLNSYVKDEVLEKLRGNQTLFQYKKSNSVIGQYMSDPTHLGQLLPLNPEQVKEKLNAVILEAKSREYFKKMSDQGIDSLSQRNNLPNLSNVVNSAQEIKSGKVPFKKAISPYQQKLQSKIENDHNRAEIDTVANTIASIKSRLESQGFDVRKMQHIQDLYHLGKGTLPATEAAAALADRKPTNIAQRVLNQIQEFKTGSFGSMVPGSVQGQDVFIKGTSVTFKTNGIPISAGYGSINDANSIKDAAYQNSIYNTTRDITYLSASISKGFASHLKLAVVSSLGNPTGNFSYAVPAPSSNNVALTLTKTMDMGQLGNVALDLSKSTTVYANKYQPGSEVAVLDQKAGLFAGPELIQSLAFGFNHTLNVSGQGLTENIYFSYSGQGYQNPANNGYGGARTKLGGSVRKSLYKNKLSLGLRSEIKSMPISYTSNDQWRNYLIQVDTRYMLSKLFNFSFKYTANGTEKTAYGVTAPVYTFQRMQADGNFNYKIGKYYSVSHFSVGKQELSNTYLSTTSSSLIMLNYTQSIVLPHNSITATVFYNKDLSNYKLIGNLLNSDLSYQFTVLKKINMSSGLTYLDNAGIARQAGIKQGIQLFSNSHFDVDSYLDVRKNLIQPLNPDLYSNCRAELMIKYHFNKLSR